MQSIFENQKISPEELPSFSPNDFIPLEKSYKKYLLLSFSMFFLLLLAGAIAFHYFTQDKNICPQAYIISYLTVLFLYMINILLINAGFPRKGYLLRKHDFLYKSGYLVHKTVAVPKNRIQHVEIRQGAVARLFKLSKLLIYTAGGSSSDLSVPGLSPETAKQLKEHLSLSVSEHE